MLLNYHIGRLVLGSLCWRFCAVGLGWYRCCRLKQHVSDINISIIRSLRLLCWITTLVVLFLVRSVLEFRCGWVGVVSVLQSEAVLYISPTVKFLFSRYFSALQKLFHASQLHRVSRSYIYIYHIIFAISWFTVRWKHFPHYFVSKQYYSTFLIY